jgi:hypothetical protein
MADTDIMAMGVTAGVAAEPIADRANTSEHQK